MDFDLTTMSHKIKCQEVKWKAKYDKEVVS